MAETKNQNSSKLLLKNSVDRLSSSQKLCTDAIDKRKMSSKIATMFKKGIKNESIQKTPSLIILKHCADVLGKDKLTVEPVIYPHEPLLSVEDLNLLHLIVQKENRYHYLSSKARKLLRKVLELNASTLNQGDGFRTDPDFKTNRQLAGGSPTDGVSVNFDKINHHEIPSDKILKFHKKGFPIPSHEISADFKPYVVWQNPEKPKRNHEGVSRKSAAIISNVLAIDEAYEEAERKLLNAIKAKLATKVELPMTLRKILGT